MVAGYYGSVWWQALALFEADATKHDLNFAFVLAALFFGLEIFRRLRTPERKRLGSMKIVRDAFVATFSGLLLYVGLNLGWHFIVIPATQNSQVTNLSSQNRQLTTQAVQDQSTINQLTRETADLQDRLNQSNALKTDWRQDYIDLVAKIAGQDLAQKITLAYDELEFRKQDAVIKDAAYKNYAERWAKHLVPHAPMSSRTDAQQAHVALANAQASADQLTSQLNSMIIIRK